MRSAAKQAGRRPKTRAVYSCHSPTFLSILEALMSRLQSRISNKNCVQEVFKGVLGSGKKIMKALIVTQNGRTSNLGVDLYSISELFPLRPSFQNFMIIAEVRRLKDVKRGQKTPILQKLLQVSHFTRATSSHLPKAWLAKIPQSSPETGEFQNANKVDCNMYSSCKSCS